ncbi:MAG TPA: DNA polymerase III subunit delta [Alphaproteobacteria bacterium]|nr:DNA polymerase III subunit delta [Alphaproteobacteria bacterium]
MKVPPARVESFLAKPDPLARAVLVYGPDAGLVRERAERLCRSVVADLNDPFRVAELSPAALREAPSRLSDEAAQIAMTGGRRVIRLREAGDAAAEILDAFLDAPAGDALIVIEAGDLPPRSKLRALCEAAENAAAVPCYGDSSESLESVIHAHLRGAGLRIAPDALDYLTQNLGSDRMITRRELEKLILYVGAGAGEIRLEDVEACIGDSAAHSVDDAVIAAADGDPKGVVVALARAFLEGETAVGVVRTAQRYFQRLHLVAGQIAAGAPVERVVDGLRPKLFWKLRARFIAQLRQWPAPRLAQALERLTMAEIACKSTGMPGEALVTRCLLELAGAAGRRQRKN